MNNRNTILVISDWYHPGYRAGGPVQSVYNLSKLLSRNFVVKVVTRNRDLNSVVPYDGIEPNTWINLEENHLVMYLNEEGQTVKNIKSLIEEEKDNIILINGLYSFKFSVLPAFFCLSLGVKRYYISVRGMLHKSALSVKPFKKQLFLAFARGFGLYKKAVMLATSDKESVEIRNVLGQSNIKVAPNIPLFPNAFSSGNQFRDKGKLRILVLGRIAPEKNTILLIQALKGIKEPCIVTFCGASIDNQYFSLFISGLADLPANIEHHYIPELPHNQIGELFDNTDLMVMPSLGENFGHAIFESFVHSVPVIIGNNTPWSGIEERLAGVEVDPKSVEQLQAALRKFSHMDDNVYMQWRKGAFETAQSYFADNNFEDIYLRLFS